MNKSIYIGVFVCLVLSGLLGYGYTRFVDLQKAQTVLAVELVTTQDTLKTTEEKLANFEAVTEILKQEFLLSQENGSELLRLLKIEKERNQDFEDQIGDISGTVGKLDKLSKINPQLLQKYSKVYFLNEHSAPEKIVAIADMYTFTNGKTEYIHSRVATHLTNLLKAALKDNVALLIVSAYRSFDEQKSLKGVYTTTYGTGANAFSADQGYSEHQLGTTVDFTTVAITSNLTGFESSEGYAWLQKNAYKYGFALSYPKDNAYYIFEPWHWRFVGKDLADDLHDDGKNFYDLPQPEIDKYLISIFD